MAIVNHVARLAANLRPRLTLSRFFSELKTSRSRDSVTSGGTGRGFSFARDPRTRGQQVRFAYRGMAVRATPQHNRRRKPQLAGKLWRPMLFAQIFKFYSVLARWARGYPLFCHRVSPSSN